jgi:hypothetical protein
MTALLLHERGYGPVFTLIADAAVSSAPFLFFAETVRSESSSSSPTSRTPVLPNEVSVELEIDE